MDFWCNTVIWYSMRVLKKRGVLPPDLAYVTCTSYPPSKTFFNLLAPSQHPKSYLKNAYFRDALWRSLSCRARNWHRTLHQLSHNTCSKLDSLMFQAFGAPCKFVTRQFLIFQLIRKDSFRQFLTIYFIAITCITTVFISGTLCSPQVKLF